MNRCLLTIGLLCITITGCNEKEKTTEVNNKTGPEEYSITKNSAGIFQLGNPIPFPDSLKNYRIQKQKQTRYTESGPVEETIFVVSKNGTELLYLKPAQPLSPNSSSQVIGEMMIASGKFQTEEGVGVGTTISEFIKTYPDAKIWYTYVSDRYIIQANKYPIQFLLTENGFNGKMEIKSVKTFLELSDFKNNTGIFMIRIYK